VIPAPGEEVNGGMNGHGVNGYHGPKMNGNGRHFAGRGRGGFYGNRGERGAGSGNGNGEVKDTAAGEEDGTANGTVNGHVNGDATPLDEKLSNLKITDNGDGNGAPTPTTNGPPRSTSKQHREHHSNHKMQYHSNHSHFQPQQRVPSADEFPSLNGTSTSTNGTTTPTMWVNAVNGIGPTAAQVLLSSLSRKGSPTPGQQGKKEVVKEEKEKVAEVKVDATVKETKSAPVVTAASVVANGVPAGENMAGSAVTKATAVAA